MAQYKNFKDLKVWHKAMDLSQTIYVHAKKFPPEETYGLKHQIQRAVVSIPSNIAEGHDRNSAKDTRQFYYIAYGSLAEVQTQLELAVRLCYLTKEEIFDTIGLIYEIRKMLWVLINNLQTL